MVLENIFTTAAYGESRFMVPISTSLFGGFKVIRTLMNSKGQDIGYQLKAKLDIDIPFMPKLTVIQDGIILLDQKPQQRDLSSQDLEVGLTLAL